MILCKWQKKKTVTPKEAQAPYRVAIDDVTLIDEVVIWEKDGQAVTAVVPMVEYQAFRVWSESKRRHRAQQGVGDSSGVANALSIP